MSAVRDWIDDTGVLGAAVAALIAVVVGFLAWAVWSELTEPKAGTVTDLDYHPEWTQQQCTTSQGVTTCTPITHPECYAVVYTDGGETGDDCAPPVVWEDLRVGDWYEQP